MLYPLSGLYEVIQLRDANTPYWARLVLIRELVERRETGLDAVTALLDLLDGEDEAERTAVGDSLRVAAAEALIDLARHEESIVFALVARLDHPDGQVRRLVAWVLGRLRPLHPDALSGLVAAVQRRETRAPVMVRALGKLGVARPDVVAVLVELVREGASDEVLADEHAAGDGIGEAAAVALAKLGVATPELIDLTEHRAQELHCIADGMAHGAYAAADMLRAVLAATREGHPDPGAAARNAGRRTDDDYRVDQPDSSWFVRRFFAQSPMPEEIALWREALHDPDPDQRRSAVEWLSAADVRDPETIDALNERLQDSDEHVRVAAIETLVELEGSTLRVWDALVACLQDKSEAVLKATLNAIEDLDAVSPAVLAGVYAHIRGKTARGPGEDRTAWFARLALSRATIGRSDPETAREWQAHLHDPDPWLRAAACKVLIGHGVDDEMHRLIRAVLLDCLRFADDSEGSIDHQGIIPGMAATLLAKLGDASPPVIEALLDALTGWRGASGAADALGRLGVTTPEVVETLFAQLQGLDHWFAPNAAPSALARLARADATVGSSVRRRLKDRWTDLPTWLHALMATLGDAAYIEALDAYFDDHGPVEYRSEWDAVHILNVVGVGDPTVTATLLRYLAHESAAIRSEAAIALGRRGDATPEVTVALAARLRDEQHGVRWAAVAALGALDNDTPEVTSALLACAKEGMPGTRAAAMRALLRLTRHDPMRREGMRALLDTAYGRGNINRLLDDTPMLTFEGTDKIRPLEERTIIRFRSFRSELRFLPFWRSSRGSG